MRIAITGASGFLGTHLVASALQAGHEVVALSRNPQRGSPAPGVTWRRGDLAEPASLRTAFSGCDVVIANAALAPGRGPADDDAFEVANVRGARHQVDAAADAGVDRVVYISTVAVYRTRLGRRLAEGAERIDPDHRRFDWNQLTTDPRYARSKARAEQAVWSAAVARGLALTSLRPGPIYGEHDHKMTQRYVDMVQRWPCLAPTVRLPHVHARDVADAALRASERPATAGRAYNTTGDAVSVHRALRALAKALGRPRPMPVPVPLAVRFDDRRARRDLGFRPRSVEEGMTQVAAWISGRRSAEASVP